jgi:hypothetical protein
MCRLSVTLISGRSEGYRHGLKTTHNSLVAEKSPGLTWLDLNESRTNSPALGVMQLPDTAHFFASKKECVTGICDRGTPTADQNGPC